MRDFRFFDVDMSRAGTENTAAQIDCFYDGLVSNRHLGELCRYCLWFVKLDT